MVTRQVENREVIKIGFEDVEIWPDWCVREKKDCQQCQLEGKIACQPRFRKGLKPLIEVSVEALLKEGKRPIEVHRITGIALGTIYSKGQKLRQRGELERLFEPYPKELKDRVINYVKEHPNEQYKDIALLFKVPKDYISRLCNKVGIQRRKMLELEKNKRVDKAIELLAKAPERSLTSLADELSISPQALASRLKRKGIIAVNHQARLVIEAIKSEVSQAVIEGILKVSILTGGDYIKRRPESCWKNHPSAGFCPVCKEDCKTIGIPSLLSTWETCECGKPEYPHLVEQLWHRDCYNKRSKGER